MEEEVFFFGEGMKILLAARLLQASPASATVCTGPRRGVCRQKEHGECIIQSRGLGLSPKHPKHSPRFRQ